MRPYISKCAFTRFYQFLAHWIISYQTSLDFLADAHLDRPRAVRHMGKMFFDRIIIGLPSIQDVVTRKARHLVWGVTSRTEVKAGLRKLLPSACHVSLLATRHLLTCSIEGFLWGHFRAFAFFVLEDLFLEVGWVVWKDARRASYVSIALEVAIAFEGESMLCTVARAFDIENIGDS